MRVRAFRFRRSRALRPFFLLSLVCTIGICIFWHTYPTRQQVRDITRPAQKTTISHTSHDIPEPIHHIRPQEQHASQTRPLPAHCPVLSGAETVLITIKTGASEAAALLPDLLSTSLQCVPNIVIVSDLVQTINGRTTYDVLTLLGPNHSEAEFDYYRNLQQHFSASQRSSPSELSNFTSSPSNRHLGWTLDKWKNIPALYLSHSLYPRAEWYVTIDADTLLSFHNLLLYLRQFDPTQPHYLGSAHTLNHPPHNGGRDWTFAQGGAGYALSSAAVQRLITKFPDPKHFDNEARMASYGDASLGLALLEVEVKVRQCGPAFQSTRWDELQWKPRVWCSPAVSVHKLASASAHGVWKAMEAWSTGSYHRGHDREGTVAAANADDMMAWRDIFRLSVQPFLVELKPGWHNGAGDRTFRHPLATRASPESGSPTLEWEVDKPWWEREAPDRWEGLTAERKQVLWQGLTEEQRRGRKSAEACRAVCLQDHNCVQWMWRDLGIGGPGGGEYGGSCGINWTVKLGKSVAMASGDRGSRAVDEEDGEERERGQQQVVSGWMLDRIDALAASWDRACEV